MSIIEILFLILKFASIHAETFQHEFKVSKNQDVNINIVELNLISSLSKMVDLLCIASCNTNSVCMTVVYDYRRGLINNCFLYDMKFHFSELVESSTTTLYEKISNSNPSKYFSLNMK
jgi:hypothetical protein